MRLRTAAALALATVAAVPASAGAADVPPGATWTQASIPSTDGVALHADILRPKGLKDTDKTPVILSIGPYFNRTGQEGAFDSANYDPVGPSTGPSDRFNDFVNGAKLMQRGYTFVMVDLRGFGGSTGCLDWGGPGEQSDVVESVKWLAKQSWSNGNVGMYGKSYDGVTGLVGTDLAPAGLKAVVAQEPVWDLYRYLYGDGMRRQNSVLTPALYDLIAATPGPLGDIPSDPNYVANSVTSDPQRPGCLPANFLEQAGNDDHYSPFWRARNLIPGAKGSQVPLIVTQGLTENNTVADGLAQYLRNHTGYERAWLGPWEHVRGNETQGNKLKMGRPGWFDEVMRFYDQFLKGSKPAVKDPPIAVQANDGKWREEAVWPPADAQTFTTELKPGAYDDNSTSAATGTNAEKGVWTISPPLTHDAHLAGSGKASVDVSCPAPNCNLVIDVYDLAPNGSGPLITRQGHLIRRNGTIDMDLWSADWKIAAGHRIGIKVADANSDWWTNVPTKQTVTVYGGDVSLPFLSFKRTGTIEGAPGVQLASYLARKVTVPADTIKTGESQSFGLPPAMKAGKR
jgi:predicted acyl esterase